MEYSTTERWIDIPGFNSVYQVSDKGRIRSFSKGKSEILSLRVTKLGYMDVGLTKKKYRYLVHVLVYTLFKELIPKGYEIDHKDRNKSNNCIENLRIATRSQNLANKNKSKYNTSGYKGVSRHLDKWRATITFQRKHIHIGRYNTAEEAAVAYDNKAKELFKDYAYLNFKEESVN